MSRYLLAMLMLLQMMGRVLGLDTATMQAMIIIEGDEGRGSGFIVKMEGKTYLVTNSHVIRGNKNLKFTNLNDEEIAVGPFEIAERADLVRAELKGSPPALAVAAAQSLKIGDEVVVAGNSEGEGVVRELPGKVTGIGPDRIEVNAEFVPGNSGSPILVKSTGRVVGVATYMKISPAAMGEFKSPTSLNEVRRFGYRLDVAKWVLPNPPHEVMKQGMKLAQLEQNLSVATSIIQAGTDTLSQGTGGFFTKESLAENPTLAALAAAVDAFAAGVRAAKDPEDGKKNVHKLLETVKFAIKNETANLKPEDFSGYFSIQVKEQTEQRGFFDRQMDGLLARVSRGDTDVFGQVNGLQKPLIMDVNKLHLKIRAETYTNAKKQKAHRVICPYANGSANTDNLYWVEETEDKNVLVLAMTGNALFLKKNTVPGMHRIHIDYRSPGLIKTVSNTVEIKIPGPSAAPQAADKGPVGPTFTNSLGMKFVAVPGTDILMCIHDTRRKDYAAFVAENPKTDATWNDAQKFHLAVAESDDHPVVCVNWMDAAAFCDWLSKKEGRTYRLPTDAEWSCAVGLGGREAKRQTPETLSNKVKEEYPWGQDWPPPKGAGNFADSSRKDSFPGEKGIDNYTDGFPVTAPVMRFKPNALGIYDLSGNVWQWCADWYDDTPKLRVLRGGAWDVFYRRMLFSSHRQSEAPAIRKNSIGFRCVTLAAAPAAARAPSSPKTDHKP